MHHRIRKLLENLYGPSGTVLLHILMFIVLMNVVRFEGRSNERGIEVVVKEIEEMEELEELEEEIEELEDVPTVVEAIEPPTTPVDQEPPPVDSLNAPGSEDVDLADFNVLDAVSPLTFTGLYSTRSAGGRAGALGKYAGGLGERTETAVMKALRWLKAHQYPDGSWGPSYRASMTGLALLTFLAHGETTASEEFGDTIRTGIRFLVSRQNGGMFKYGGPVSFWHYPVKYSDQLQVYEHAISTYAICEAYSLTSIPYLKKPMEDAVQIMLDGQHEAGSWDYGYAHGADAHVDVSLAGWHIQALKAASVAGAENPGLAAAIEASIRGLDLQFRKTKRFQYSTRNLEHKEDVPMTAVAVLCKQLTGHALDENTRRAMIALRNAKFKWAPDADKGPPVTGSWPFYTWYYLTQTRFQQGGRGWDAWNRQFAPRLCDMQNPDGSWCPAPNSQETMFGPVYFTTLATLQLEVYYRVLPTYQPIDVEGEISLDTVGEKDDIVITFE